MVRQIRILVADDEELERKIISETLKSCLEDDDKHEIVVFQAQDGHEALEIVEAQNLSAAFLDVRMPGLNGLQVAEKAQKIYPGFTFTFVSAYGEYPILRSALKLDANDYLLKPVRRKDIADALWKMIDHLKIEIKGEVESSSFISKDTVLLSDDVSWQPFNSTKKMTSAAKSYVRQNINKQLTLEEVAEYVGFSPSYFSTVFSKEEKITFKEYLVHTRINRAKALIADTKLPLKAVARETGFQDPNYFSKVFSRKVGLTPSQYRLLEGKDDSWKMFKQNSSEVR